jgi:hypothetical protein
MKYIVISLMVLSSGIARANEVRSIPLLPSSSTDADEVVVKPRANGKAAIATGSTLITAGVAHLAAGIVLGTYFFRYSGCHHEECLGSAGAGASLLAVHSIVGANLIGFGAKSLKAGLQEARRPKLAFSPVGLSGQF